MNYFSILGAMWLLTCALGVCAQPLERAALQWQRVELGAAGQRYPFAIYSNKPLPDQHAQVRRAVVVFHGMGRNGAAYYAAAQRLLDDSGAGAATLLLVPNFFVAADAEKQPIEGLPLWRGSRWNRGENAVNWQQPLSSFAVIDDVRKWLADRTRFPALDTVMLAGHSAGGQLVHRYAVLNGLDEALRAQGISTQYLIANPSSFLYLTPERPERAGGSAFEPYDTALCPNYNRYRYGLDGLPPYAGDISAPALLARYARRDIAILLGSADADPDHSQLDKSCGAQAGGSNRLERGRNFIRYEQYLAQSLPMPKRRSYEVIGAGHSQASMFGSNCGARLLFGLGEDRKTAGAACRAPQLSSGATKY